MKNRFVRKLARLNVRGEVHFGDLNRLEPGGNDLCPIFLDHLGTRDESEIFGGRGLEVASKADDSNAFPMDEGR